MLLVGNDSKLVKIKQVHYKKLHASGKNCLIRTHDSDKVIFNDSSHKLSNIEKNVLVRGLNFALPPMKLNYGDLQLLNCCFEMLQSYQFPMIKNFPKLCPVLSAINPTTHGWDTFFVPFIKCFILIEYTLKDSFEFAKYTTNQN